MISLKDNPVAALKVGTGIHLAITATCALALFILMGSQGGIAYLAGSFLILIDVLGLVLIWWLAVIKKAVAAGVLAVVSKYAFLGISIYFLIVRLKLSVPAFIAGVATIVGTTLCYSLYTSMKEKQNAGTL